MQSLFAVSESISMVAAPAKPSKTTSKLFIFGENKKLAAFSRFLGGTCAYQKLGHRNFMIRIVGIKEPSVSAAPN